MNRRSFIGAAASAAAGFAFRPDEALGQRITRKNIEEHIQEQVLGSGIFSDEYRALASRFGFDLVKVDDIGKVRGRWFQDSGSVLYATQDELDRLTSAFRQEMYIAGFHEYAHGFFDTLPPERQVEYRDQLKTTESEYFLVLGRIPHRMVIERPEYYGDLDLTYDSFLNVEIFRRKEGTYRELYADDYDVNPETARGLMFVVNVNSRLLPENLVKQAYIDEQIAVNFRGTEAFAFLFTGAINVNELVLGFEPKFDVERIPANLRNFYDGFIHPTYLRAPPGSSR